MTTYATNVNPDFVPDPAFCSVHWTFVGGEVQCLLEPEHRGRPCEFMLAGKRMLDPRVPVEAIPEYERQEPEHRVYVGKQRDHRVIEEAATVVDAVIQVAEVEKSR